MMRITLAMASFFVAWTLTINGFLFVGIELWNNFVLFTGSSVNEMIDTWNNHDVFSSMAHIGYLHGNIQLEPCLVLSLEVAGCLLFFSILWVCFGSLHQSILSIEAEVTEIPQEHPLYILVKDVCVHAGHHRMPKVYISASNTLNAFALSKPFKSAIVVNYRLLDVPQKELAWVVAHELGHIHYGDAYSSNLWASTAIVENMSLYIRYYVMRIIYPILLRFPYLWVIGLPIIWMLELFTYLSDKISWCSQRLLAVIDCYAQRRMEYRADEYASHLIGGVHGIRILSHIGSGTNTKKRFHLFDTHPRISKRIKRLEKLEGQA